MSLMLPVTPPVPAWTRGHSGLLTNMRYSPGTAHCSAGCGTGLAPPDHHTARNSPLNCQVLPGRPPTGAVQGTVTRGRTACAHPRLEATEEDTQVAEQHFCFHSVTVTCCSFVLCTQTISLYAWTCTPTSACAYSPRSAHTYVRVAQACTPVPLRGAHRPGTDRPLTAERASDTAVHWAAPQLPGVLVGSDLKNRLSRGVGTKTVTL